MAFNYDVKGLGIDFSIPGDIMRAKDYGRQMDLAERQQAASEAEKEAAKREQERKERLIAQINARKEQGEDASDLETSLLGLDPKMASALNELNTNMSEERKGIFYDTILESKRLYDAGDSEGMLKVWREREDALKRHKSSSNITGQIVKALESGDPAKVQKLLDFGYELGVNDGYFKAPPANKLEKIGMGQDAEGNEEIIMFDPINQVTKRVPTGNKATLGEGEGGLGEDEFPDLSPQIRKRANEIDVKIDEQRSLYTAAGGLSKKYADIAAQGKWTEQGIAGAMADGFLGLIGKEDPNTFVRNTANKFFNSSVVANRPPGAMSNFEFKTIRAGFPKVYGNPELMSKYFKELEEAIQLESELMAAKGRFMETTNRTRLAPRDVNIDGIELEAGDSVDDYLNKYMKRLNEEKGARMKMQKEQDDAAEAARVQDAQKTIDAAGGKPIQYGDYIMRVR